MAGTRSKAKKRDKRLAKRARRTPGAVAKPRAKARPKAKGKVKAAAKKSPSKQGKLTTRGIKPARRAKASELPARAKPKGTVPRGIAAKGAAKARRKQPHSARRRVRDQRHLLTSVRRPKAAKPRGPARARVSPPGQHVKGRAGNGAPRRYEIRDFVPTDADAVNALALAAFEQYRGAYSDWPEFAKSVGAMASLAEGGEIIVAHHNGRIAGAVAYLPPAPRPAMFDPDWPVIRMLVVDPAERRQGLGRQLTEECIRRARRDGASAIALHTSPIMQVALAMYLRLGFVPARETAAVFGVPYRIYLKRL